MLKIYFDEKVFELQFWPSNKKLQLHDVWKKIGQPLKIFLYDRTIHAF